MRILIVDDHQIVRRGVRSLLEAENGFQVCGEAVDGLDAIRKVQELKPQAVVMDLSMPNLNGLEATREIYHLLPGLPIVMLTQHDSAEMMRQALNAGASAYVVKSAISTDLVAVLEKIRSGERPIASKVFGSAQDNVDLQEILQRSAAFEIALRESEERFRLTFEQAGVGIAHVAEDGRWLRVNRRLCEIVGYTEAELTNLTFQEITHPADLADHVARAEKLAAGKLDHYAMEKRHIRKDGTVIWINLTVAPVRDGAGRLKYFISIVEDINTRKLAEEELAQKASLLDLSTDAIIVRDSADRVIYWNNSASEMYGYTREEALGRVTHDLLGTQFPEPLTLLCDYLNTNNHWSGELCHLRKDGSKLTVSSRWCVVRDANGKLKAVLETNRDITAELALRLLEQKLGRDRPQKEDARTNVDPIIAGVLTAEI